MAGRSLVCRERLEPNGDYRLRLWSQIFAQESEKPLLRLCAFTGAQSEASLIPVQISATKGVDGNHHSAQASHDMLDYGPPCKL